MAQHLNTNQIHQMTQIPMLQGINLTILNNQQHLGQFAAAQPGHQGMYQIVQQPTQLQMQNVVQQQQHQFSSLQHMQQQQHLQHQQQHILVPQQHTAAFTQQQLQHLQINQQQMIQQQAQQQQQIQQQQQQQQQAQQQQQHQQAQQQQMIQQQQQQTNGKGKGKKKGPKVNKEGVPAPKRATTAYINFTQWYREEIKKTGRSVPKVGEFGKECAAKWNQMTEEEKKPFTDVANKDRERYKKEMEIYKPARDVNKPKRPGTAFMLFMVDFRKEVAGKEPEGGVAALAKLGGERWRNMTDEEKKPYCDKQNECKMTYEIAMEEYRKSSGQMALHSVQVKGEGQSAELNSIGDSDTSEQLNNSLSNLSNNHTLDTSEQVINNHNSQSPASNSTSPSGQSISPNLQQQQQQAAAQQQQLQEQQQQQANGNALDQLAGNFYTDSSYNAAAAFHADSDLDRQLEQQLDQVSHDGTADAFLQAATQQQPYQTQSHYSWN